MERVHIREAQAVDLDDLLQLLQLLFSIEKDFQFDAARQQRGLEMLLNSDAAVIMAAEAENQLVGMCTGQLVISTAEGGFSLLVEDVVVDRSWQRQGVGTQLLKRIERWAREKNASRSQLLVDRGNDLGLRFYKKQSWHPTQLFCLWKRF